MELNGIINGLCNQVKDRKFSSSFYRNVKNDYGVYLSVVLNATGAENEFHACANAFLSGNDFLSEEVDCNDDSQRNDGIQEADCYSRIFEESIVTVFMFVVLARHNL
jgi:hypothetical protein